MRRKRVKRRKRARRTTVQHNAESKRWTLVIDSQEAAINFYSILYPLYSSNGAGLINEEAVTYVAAWLDTLSKHIPDIAELANDSCGPFRPRDRSPREIVLKLDRKERELMLVIWQAMYQQLIAPETRDGWTRDQGREDYELAMKDYEAWISALD
jgi:hypothetical protein